jgi:aryl-alcohol dehydrogenase-like predicted oxidoreductase
MEYTRLGMTDLTISRIGFGGWAIGGHGYGKVDDKESIEAVKKALDLGINFFDTADVYGFGHSEEILAKALGVKRNDVVIATKFGVNWDSNGRTFKDCSSKRMSQALEDSLRRLRVCTIPLYQIHWPDLLTPFEETMGALLKCQRDGKIKYIGCSNFNEDSIRELQKLGRVESLQFKYNLLDRFVEKKIFSCCQEYEMSFMVHHPLARGFLSGKYKPGHIFLDNDTRNRSLYFSEDKLDEKMRLVNMTRAMGERYGKTPSQVALRWILGNPMVTCVVVGSKNMNQVEENVGSVDWNLTQDDIESLDAQSQMFIYTEKS